jgi:hypothetical protein
MSVRNKVLLSVGAFALAIAPAAVKAQGLSVHGSFSQSAAFANDKINGASIAEEGRFDLRRANVVIGYDFSSTERLVVRAAHGNLGYTTAGQSVGIDRAFYERETGLGRIRVGRTAMPFGFQNETRQDGTSPFFQAPAVMYDTQVEENVDGATITKGFGAASVDAFYGMPAGAKRAYGVQGSYNTGISGIKLNAGVTKTERAADETMFNGGVTGTFDRLSIAGEVRKIKDVDNQNYYGWAGYQVNETMGVHGLYQVAGTTDNNDIGLGVTWATSKFSTIKLEGHSAKGMISGTPSNMTGQTGMYGVATIGVRF